MPALRLVDEHSVLGSEDRAWLATLVDGWHLIADLSFSDLVLWVPDADDNIFWAVAQIRPATGPTALEEDVIGECLAYDADALVTEAYLSELICETSDNQLRAGIPVDVLAIPIMRGGRCIGIVERHTNRMGVRAPGALEDAYLEAASRLEEMVWRSQFPMRAQGLEASDSPRVGDGMLRIDAGGIVVYASPNAVTAYRRLGLVGDLEGEDFIDTTRSLLVEGRTPVEQPGLDSVLRARIVDLEGLRASLRIRLQPLLHHDVPDGAIALLRDTTELRHRERQLVTKDATIREIHHRVKNNLQTVAALLRLQSRRMHSEEARAALGEAQARVSAIAVVHELLSQAFEDTVEFDAICDRILAMVGAVASTQGIVAATRVGSFGALPGDVATNVALIVTELCQNAVEHGLSSGGGKVTILPTRNAEGLRIEVRDDGAGLPEDFDLAHSHSLGLSIVATLTADLGGQLSLGSNAGDAGSTATVLLPADVIG